MKQVIPYLFWIGLSLMSLKVVGQVNVDFPADRAVFQRDKNNTATIYIAGSYKSTVDKVEAKLTAINGGTSIDWTTIKTNPQGGFYSGSLNATGGWYTLDVRISLGSTIVAATQIAHVGIGEVFIIAGQSNGQGFDNFGGPGAQDDRVSTIDYTNLNETEVHDLPYPHFAHLDEHTNIAPRGISSWSWGRLGDLITSKLKVPVLFYNVAWYSSSVGNWVESINGTAYSVYVPGVPYEPAGMPYGNFRSVIQRYTPITGLRGVLWDQGEAEVKAGTDTEKYYQLLKTLIETSRNESGKNISWMVSLTSYDNVNGINTKTVEGQKKVISTVSNVFQGPNTDIIQIPRSNSAGGGGVHFDGDGLIQLAEAWNTQLDDNFFSKSEPFKGISPLVVSEACAGNGNISLSVGTTGLSSVSWNNGQNSNIVQVGKGTYRASARDEKGNFIFSPEIRIDQDIVPVQPVISLVGSNPVCLGNTVTLVSSTAENLKWSTGATTEKLVVTQGGDYSVITKNIYGCESTSAKTSITVLTSPLPAKPIITTAGAVTFCEGGQVGLASSSSVNSLWSNGETTKNISAKVSGEYRVKAVDNVGCFSPDSDPVVVKVNPLPQKPVIALSGTSTFCDGEKVTLTSSFDTGNIWTGGATTKAISVGVTGKFSVKERDVNGCEATSDEISINVNPLPETPTIASLRPTTFCQNDYTVLQSSAAFSYKWSNGSTSKEVEIRESGNFTIAATDQNGCTSPVSKAIAVVANPNPTTPVITADGPLTFCENLSVNLKSGAASGFQWSNGANTQVLNVKSTGTFSVKAINEFKCFSESSNEISTQTLSLPSAPTIEAIGLTTFCQGDTVLLQSVDGSQVYWNSSLQSSSLKVAESDNYFATSKDEKGCFSLHSNEISVEVKTKPTTPVIEQTGTYTLIAANNVNGGEHIWNRNGTVLPETSMRLKARQSGSYTVNNFVIYNSSLTCYSDYSAPFEFIADSKNSALAVYPNPVTDSKVTVETIDDITDATLQIVDSKGIVYKTFTIKKMDQQQVLNVTGLASGIYIIRIISAQLNTAQKLVIVQ